MALMPLKHFSWQVLRAIKRSRKPPTGRELRIWPSRATKDGTFLDDLVNEGLIAVVRVDELPAKATDKQKKLPVQFRTRYRLTVLGEHAAEYGEYQKEIRRAEK